MSKSKLQVSKQVAIKNNRAYFEYEVLDKYTAGIVLRGTEIKSIRLNKVNLADAYCNFRNGELYLVGMHISHYEQQSILLNHQPNAERKLLLTRTELKKLEKHSQDVGLTIVPLRIFTNDKNLLKVEIALAKGKKHFDKRNTIKERDMDREMARIKF